MRKATAIITFLLTLCGSIVYSQELVPIDTISPPPAFADTIIGPQQACEGETSLYTTDIPISCSASWYLDGVIQTSGSDLLEILWTAGGNYILSRELNCDTSNLPPSYMEIEVASLPQAPANISGAEDICIQSTGLYATQVMAGEGCQWKVDGIIQPSDSAQLSYYWGLPGGHSIEVHAINDCGLSQGISMEVYVNEWPVVDLGNDTTLLEGQSLVLDAGNQGCDFLWSTGDTTQTLEVSTSGWYEVQVNNACGEVSDEIHVEVLVGNTEAYHETDIRITISGNYLQVTSLRQAIKKIQLFDVVGRLVINSSGNQELLLSKKGLYLIRVITNEGNTKEQKVLFMP